MATERLSPKLGLVSEEYVLVQAWKKTANYIRYHNWYADTLELDRASVNLPQFLAELRTDIRNASGWKPSPLRIVPAPKSQEWQVTGNDNHWQPAGRRKSYAPIRPLAHVGLKDQVVATALSLCLADRAESLQGDTSADIADASVRRQVISYGNRLFCDSSNGGLVHRWGSAKFYREYFQDYRTFVNRPEAVAQKLKISNDERVLIVHSDLKQFYDRVRPALMQQRLRQIASSDDDNQFFDFAFSVLNWHWDQRDEREIARYEKQAKLEDFSNVALPQGLAAAGFFANIVLLHFDQSLRSSIDQNLSDGIKLNDVCRYVDDLRLVLTTPTECDLETIRTRVSDWLQKTLCASTPGLQISDEKTKIATPDEDRRPLVRQAKKMERIQKSVSCGFDAVGGEEILDAIQGLVRSQERYSESREHLNQWAFSPFADVRDATVDRFAAARYRRTYRSLRPLLVEGETTSAETSQSSNGLHGYQSRVSRTQADLDDDARAFALGLIEKWVYDPSNVRLLRVGLDIWPAHDLLDGVLDLLRPYVSIGGSRGDPKRVAWYCMSEIFRAGATETGMVPDPESLSPSLNLKEYHNVLRKEAIRLLDSSQSVLPWYLKQQAMLFLAVSEPNDAPIKRVGEKSETKPYRQLLKFLCGDFNKLNSIEFSIFALLAHHSFSSEEVARKLALQNLTPLKLENIATRDLSFGIDLINSKPELVSELPARLRHDLCISARTPPDEYQLLSRVVLDDGPANKLRSEYAILQFARQFLTAVEKSDLQIITPSDVYIQFSETDKGQIRVKDIRLQGTGSFKGPSIYAPPSWCNPEYQWRFQLGFLIRFILSARRDFTASISTKALHTKPSHYRPAKSHWYQRIHGFFSGQSAFGDDWLPISDWTEQFIHHLLRWPGCLESDNSQNKETLNTLCLSIKQRLGELDTLQASSGNLKIVPLKISRPLGAQRIRPIRACVVQTVFPGEKDYIDAAKDGDLRFSHPDRRKQHRNHLSAALSAVARMLDLRETHRGADGRLDWLILPELAVHRDDVETHLLPFVRAYKTIVLAGLTYQEIFTGKPLVNSALWIVPSYSRSNGLQITIRRQGKQHLSPLEQTLNSSENLVHGFRPCQWLIGYEWGKANDPCLWLTSSVCYDATDISLAACLRDHSDVYAIPALNRDVNTFDQMAMALHYHMFQYVVIANNGGYGGTNAYAPMRDTFKRQVFHMHGQPQATMAFFEIDNIAEYLRRKDANRSNQITERWKFPPAGLT